MNKLMWPASVAVTACFLLGLSPRDALAQANNVEEAVEEIVTIGTRRQGRSAIDTAVPIDVFNQEELDSVSSDDLIDVVKTLVPSFSVSRQPINDGASFIRPPQLRGLDSDKTLVLVNGKRRHRAALVVLGGFGSHGPDLATIPSIALKSIEVLRDGAAAQYGSDAIAGVMNFNLRDDAEGGEARMQVSQFSEGDEATGYLGALNFGFGLGNSGFVNASVEISDNEPTSRGTFYGIGIGSSGRAPHEAATDSALETIVDDQGNPLFTQQRYGPDALTEVYDSTTGQLVSIRNSSDGILDDPDTRYADGICFAEVGQGNCLTQVWGEPDRDAIRSFVNMGLDLNNSTSLYGWANYSDSNSNTSFFHRRPGVSQLQLVRQEDGRIYNPRDRYPGGFTPRFFGNVIDYSFTGGVRGEWDNGISYDFSGRYGHNDITYDIRNTLNPSLGPASPRDFRPGTLENEETEFGADFSRGFDIGWANELNLAFGFSYRDESYDIQQGNEPSFRIGPYAAVDPHNFEITQAEIDAGNNTNALGQTFTVPGCYIPGLENTAYYGPGAAPGADTAAGQLCTAGDPIYNAVPVGSNGFPGYGPNFTSSYSRDSWATYVDLETDITDNLLVNVALRYEDYSDFGDNFSWKVAGRYRIGDAVSVRASAGTGFRAPTGGQISTVNVATRIAPDGSPVAEGIFPSDGPIAGLFGFSPLSDETSEQFTFGITATPSDSLTLTLDYYFIAMDDRIVLSSDFQVTPAISAQLQALGVPGANTIAQVSFFTNDVESETQGIDLVATYGWDWAAGSSQVALSANWNDTEITDPGQFLNDEDVFDEENNAPSPRANLTLRHTWENDVTFTLRANYFGDYRLSDGNNAPLTIASLGAVTQFDFDVTWDVNDTYRLTIGANNVFDELPDDAPFEACCGRIIASGSIQDWQGPQYYVRGMIAWD